METKAPFLLYLVVPCYNEEQVLESTSLQLEAKFGEMVEQSRISQDSRVLFVDDGSSDCTWNTIVQLHERNELFSGLKLSRNRGHQNALLAGLTYAMNHADVVASMDADLQDDVNVLSEMAEMIKKGYEVVYGVRNDRTTDSGFKRGTAQAFYRFQSLMGVEAVQNHADYRMMTSRAVKALSEFKEVNLFLRGLVPLVGFKSCNVYYARGERAAGESKYGLGKMLSFAVEGITSFSIKPVRLISVTGVLVSLLSLVALIYVFIGAFIGNVQPGWASTMVSVWLFGGIQLLSLGVIGEYVGRIYLETKARPRYIIEAVTLPPASPQACTEVRSH